MAYTLENWQDNVTPITASNLNLYNAAINDLDTRIVTRQAAMSIAAVQSGSYTALVNQLVPVDTSTASVTVTFPGAPVDGARIGVKHVVRGATNLVTLQAGGTDTFNTASGPTALILQVVNEVALFQYAAATGVWVSLLDSVPLTAISARSVAMAMVLGTFAP